MSHNFDLLLFFLAFTVINAFIFERILFTRQISCFALFIFTTIFVVLYNYLIQRLTLCLFRIRDFTAHRLYFFSLGFLVLFLYLLCKSFQRKLGFQTNFRIRGYQTRNLLKSKFLVLIELSLYASALFNIKVELLEDLFTSAVSNHRFNDKKILLHYVPPLFYFFKRSLQLLTELPLKHLQTIDLSLNYSLQQLLTLIFFSAFDLQYLLEMFAKSLYSEELVILIKIFMLLDQSL